MSNIYLQNGSKGAGVGLGAGTGVGGGAVTGPGVGTDGGGVIAEGGGLKGPNWQRAPLNPNGQAHLAKEHSASLKQGSRISRVKVNSKCENI